ncbi:MAG: tRNA (adenosine(37)-N6)-threonylcarbamoyltransferase complex ATPase subunit type 1 TsaE [Bacteroidales bacterium]|nr:tRNA (adenosine(37)-N6)-threonylcarbamoyltransferase complex ATPase subunit type 1 TsaE [Bacteroidales bacterium]
MVTFRIENLGEIRKTAKNFLDHFRSNRIFAFYGPLGSGKTTFIKALCEELQAEDNVSSPSFSIVNEYSSKGNGEIYHFDFYRLEKQEEVYDLGYEEYFYTGKFCFIEWPDIVKDILPEETIHVRIQPNASSARLLKVFDPSGI